MSHQPYYLPVSRHTAEQFLSTGSVPDTLIERVGLLAMLAVVGRPGMGRHALGRLIAEADASLWRVDAGEVALQLQSIKSNVKDVQQDNVEALLAEQGVEFASEEKLSAGLWRGMNGRYTPAFQEACRDTLQEFDFALECGSRAEADKVYEDTDTSIVPVRQWARSSGTRDQVVITQAFAADPDEHFALTAYAGSGKTHLLFALAGTGIECTHLAPTNAHQFAFRQRVGSAGVESKTLYELAMTIASRFFQQRGTRWAKPPQVRDSNWPFARQADVAGLSSIDGVEPYVVLRGVHATLRAWCYSQDEEVGLHHLPRSLSLLSVSEKNVYISYARRVWDLMFPANNPGSEQIFSIKLYHVVKWLGLAGACIPPMGTLLVDEAHDLPGCWYHLLDRYPHGWVMMADPYQSTASRTFEVGRAKKFGMVQSVRTGEQAMPFVRGVLAHHSQELVTAPIVGSRDHVTRPKLYDQKAELPEQGLRVYGSEWFMLADALRLKDAGASFRFVPASGDQLHKAVRDAISLRKYRERPKSYGLRGFTAWSELADYFAEIGCPSVARLFNRGFDVPNLDELFQAQSTNGEQAVLLGMLDHCKNLEYSAVLMSNCCFLDTFRRSEKDLFFRSVYVAMTRVQDELWLPGDAMDKLDDIARLG